MATSTVVPTPHLWALFRQELQPRCTRRILPDRPRIPMPVRCPASPVSHLVTPAPRDRFLTPCAQGTAQ